MGLHGVGGSDLTKSLAFAAGSPGQDSCCTDPSVDSELETLKQCDGRHCGIVAAQAGLARETEVEGYLLLVSEIRLGTCSGTENGICRSALADPRENTREVGPHPLMPG